MIAAAYLSLTPSGASRQRTARPSLRGGSPRAKMLPQRGSHTPRWGQSYFVHRGVYTRDDCEAGAHTGCGNPYPPVPPQRKTPVLREPPSLVQKWGIQWGRSPLGRRGGIPCPYSPEYGAAPCGRCLKIPAKRPSQIETHRFDLMRRSHRAIRSFRSITVLRKRSERRALRRGSLWRFLFPVSFPLKETGSRRSARSPRPVPVFRPRRSGDLSTTGLA